MVHWFTFCTWIALGWFIYVQRQQKSKTCISFVFFSPISCIKSSIQVPSKLLRDTLHVSESSRHGPDPALVLQPASPSSCSASLPTTHWGAVMPSVAAVAWLVSSPHLASPGDRCIPERTSPSLHRLHSIGFKTIYTSIRLPFNVQLLNVRFFSRSIENSLPTGHKVSSLYRMKDESRVFGMSSFTFARPNGDAHAHTREGNRLGRIVWLCFMALINLTTIKCNCVIKNPM